MWCVDHVPATAGYLPSEKPDETGPAKSGAWYLENGTTLCHVFWATFWAPLLLAGTVSLFVSMIVMVHVEAHYEFVAKNPGYSPTVQFIAFFIPEVFLLVAVIALAVFVLAIIGCSRSGFFPLLWEYLKGMKQRVCPLVAFDRPESHRG